MTTLAAAVARRRSCSVARNRRIPGFASWRCSARHPGGPGSISGGCNGGTSPRVAAVFLSARSSESPERLVARLPESFLHHGVAAAIVSVAVVTAFIGDQYLGVLRASDSLPAGSRTSIFAPPTDTRWRADTFVANVEPGDRVICNDELACLFLAGRVDDWLLPAERIVDRYTAAGVEGRHGVYAGANVVATGGALERIIECGGRAVAIIVLDTGKFDYLEPRALALQMARKFRGNVTAAGGEHLIVRISDARVTRACEGGES